MSDSANILAQFQHLEKSGALDALGDLRKENRELERIITDAALLVSYTDVNAMLDFMIAKFLDHFIPQFLGFLVHPPRGEKLRQFTFRNLKESADHIDPLYFDLLREHFSKEPGSVTFDELSEKLGEGLFDAEFRKLQPELIFPMYGIGGVYGVVILGKKIVGSGYTELEQKYIDRMIRFLSVTMQNGLHYESSITDPKTGLFNHDYFVRRLDEAVAQCRRRNRTAGILMMDVDHFKKFNDTWGHVTGDAVLVAIAQTLKECTRTEDCAARFGGEEFSVLVAECTPANLMMVAERIRSAVENLNLTSGGSALKVTISIGARMIDPDPRINSLVLIGDADKALYKSKSTGRNRCSLFAVGLLSRALLGVSLSEGQAPS
ncbi:MAG TPA: GGDEF domain-containing protein [Treponemataceae bacterium]|nr:GGDEF domain-containing protein [Treponemataceae bacterium]